MSFSENPWKHVQFKVVTPENATWRPISWGVVSVGDRIRIEDSESSTRVEGTVAGVTEDLWVEFASQFRAPMRGRVYLQDPIGIHLECSSCGGGWQNIVPPSTTAQTLMEMQHTHLRASHSLKPEDCEGWS